MLLIDVVPQELKSPETTGKWEKGLSSISKSKMDPARFMASIFRFVNFLVDQAKNTQAVAVFPTENRKFGNAAPAQPAATATTGKAATGKTVAGKAATGKAAAGKAATGKAASTAKAAKASAAGNGPNAVGPAAPKKAPAKPRTKKKDSNS
jgi:DNA topoisomerase-3